MNSKYLNILFIFSVLFKFLFAQSTLNQLSSISNKDSLISFYEKMGFLFYYSLHYDSAISNYIKAESVINYYLKKKPALSLYIDSVITMCNIGMCYSKLKKFVSVTHNLPPDHDFCTITRWRKEFRPKDITSDKSTHDYILLLAYIQSLNGECRLEINKPSEAINAFKDAWGNLKQYNFQTSQVLTYPFALFSFTLQSAYLDLANYFLNKGDTINAKEYYEKAFEATGAK